MEQQQTITPTSADSTVAKDTSYPKKEGFHFKGDGDEYFKIWIVNLLLSVMTLGIYSAWATVRNRRYFYGNTFFNEANFNYNATGWQIFKGRLIAVLAFVLVAFVGSFFPVVKMLLSLLILLAAPFLFWGALRFNARMSSYKNVKFVFSGQLSTLYSYLLKAALIPIAFAAVASAVAYTPLVHRDHAAEMIFLTFLLGVYLMLPFVQALFHSYYINNSQFGQGKFKADLAVSFYYKAYLKTFGLGLAITAIYISVNYTLETHGFISFSDYLEGDDGIEQLFKTFGFTAVVLFYLSLLFFSMLLKAYLETQIRNYRFNQTSLDDVLSLQSKLRVGGLLKLRVVNLFILLFTFGFGYPWVAVRNARYTAQCTEAEVHGDLAHYLTQQENRQSSLAQEMGDAFDYESDMGITL